jgi:hypothetical protein
LRNPGIFDSRDEDSHVLIYRATRFPEEYLIDAHVDIDEERLVRLEVYAKQLDLTLDEIIETLGNPQQVFFVYGTSVERISPQGVWASYTVYYPSEGFQFSVSVSHYRLDNSQITICPSGEDHVTRASIVASDTIDLASMMLPPGELMNWTGFDCISLPYNY